MSTDLATVDAPTVELNKLAVLLGLNPADPKTRAMVMVAHRYGLDPVLKHVIVIPGSGPYITRDGLLHVAHRSGVFDGIELVDGPRLEGDQWVATVRVWRKDMGHAITYPGRYALSGKNKQYGPEMAIARAETNTLRRAFDVGGMPVLEEMALEGEQPPMPIPASSDTSDPNKISPAQLKKLWATMKRADMENKDVARAWMASVLGLQPEQVHTAELSREQADQLFAELKLLIGRGADRTRPPARDDVGEASPAPDQWTVDPQTGELRDLLEIVDDEKPS